ncbi:M23 family metallopeptidase [Geothrix sp. 21YS21S-4]|uniref:M23 family metallopeptidase n=1 Tax=Geothrix sp. 21YS21S-4 TaxID=3068889 RepID=UPI0027B9EB68|nr:M23 family metallopeptidase [Geothrix sp. 21YS21S-4]
MSSPQPERRRAVRSSRPDSVRWLTVMVVFSHRTFRWSLTRRTMLWVLGCVAGFSALAMIGSGYGLWATKKIMNFGRLQRETQEQQQQIRLSLTQAQALEAEVATLRQQHTELLKLLDPKAPTTSPIPAPPDQSSAAPIPPGARERLSKLRQDLDYTAKQAAVVRARMEPVLRAWSHTPSIPPTAGYLSSGFGVRVSPFSRGNEAGDGLLGYHSGLDISNVLDTPIQVTADGEVVEAGWMDRYGWGVRVRHTDEEETLYAHLNRVDVKTGQQVSRGDILGTMGRSGNATGVHLHYEVRRNGKAVNPQPYLRLQRQWLKALGKPS